jgi:hypothetical protein
MLDVERWTFSVRRFDQRIHRSQRFFAGKHRTLCKTVDVLTGKLPRLSSNNESSS